MGVKLAGKPVVEYLRENIKSRVAILGEKDINPTLLLIRVGEREDDISYERSILKNCELLGIKINVKQLPIDVTMEEVTKVFAEANTDKFVHGIMIFRPLPAQLDVDVICNLIDPAKDIDCMNP